MDQKRFLAFIVLSMTILIGWSQFVVPRFFPPAKPNPAAQKAPADPAKPDAGAAAELARGKPDAAEEDDADPEAKAKSPRDVAEQPDQEAENDAVPEQPVAGKPAVDNLPKFPEQTVVLGSLDPKSEFRQLVTLTSRGGAVEKVELNDPRYTTLRPAPPPLPQKPHPPLAVVGTDDVKPYTLAMRVPQIDAVADLSRLNWQVIDVQPAAAPHSEATFRVELEGLEITRHYKLATVDTKTDSDAPAYELQVDLTFKNLKTKAQTVNYELQGPTGLPLENEDNTQKFRDVVVGFAKAPGVVEHQMMAAKAIAKDQVEKWETAFDYIGVDVQYFAALLLPVDDQRVTKYIASATQERLGPNLDERSEISVLLTSVDLDLEPAPNAAGKDSVTHSYRLFAGPKRDDVLPAGTSKVIDFGWFHWVSRPMLALLKGFHNVTGSWGIAIICLTIVVRSVLFPLSIKQARGAAKMQELQPKIAELKEKYGKDKEKMARAQMELFSQHKYNPLAGCLPVFLQLPIFMGLYSALNHSVDLRMAQFLWIENLAAPDALFPLPFVVPFFGWKVFNLLPLITIALFIVQQKMFMPPPTSDEQAMQQKMMNYMMIFMGVMFYKVPAGLCVYFIASSLWGMAERKLLPKAKPATIPPSGPAAGGDKPGSGGKRKPPDAGDGNGNGNGKEGGGLFAMLLKAAEKETSARKAPQGKRK